LTVWQEPTFQAAPPNIRLGCKYLPGTNTLAYWAHLYESIPGVYLSGCSTLGYAPCLTNNHHTRLLMLAKSNYSRVLCSFVRYKKISVVIRAQFFLKLLAKFWLKLGVV